VDLGHAEDGDDRVADELLLPPNSPTTASIRSK